MTKTEAKVLVREIGKLVIIGGFGARIVARRLPVEEIKDLLVIPFPISNVRAKVFSVLHSVGTITDEFVAERPIDTISAIVGSGNMNLNPTIVHVRITQSSDTSTTLSFQALAKEGLIKQQSAKRAIERIETLISNEYAEKTP